MFIIIDSSKVIDLSVTIGSSNVINSNHMFIKCYRFFCNLRSSKVIDLFVTDRFTEGHRFVCSHRFIKSCTFVCGHRFIWLHRFVYGQVFDETTCLFLPRLFRLQVCFRLQLYLSHKFDKFPGIHASLIWRLFTGKSTWHITSPGDMSPGVRLLFKLPLGIDELQDRCHCPSHSENLCYKFFNRWSCVLRENYFLLNIWNVLIFISRWWCLWLSMNSLISCSLRSRLEQLQS